MGKLKKLLCCFFAGLLLLSSIGYTPGLAYAKEEDTNDAPGWYLESYKLIINLKQTSGSFMQGGTYRDIVKIFDLEGNEMQGLESDLENDIMLSYGRYGGDDSFLCGYSQNISWDSPEDYYSEGTKISLTGITNKEVSHVSWNCRNISARFNVQTIYDTYDYRFLDTNGSDQFGVGTEEASVTTASPIPKAIRGDKAYLIINFDYGTNADSQAVYTYVWNAPNDPIKEKTYKTAVTKKGWYLTGYHFEYVDNLYYESYFGDGTKCIDNMKVFDANGDKAGKKLENDIYIYDERYFGAFQPQNFGIGVRSEIRWDSPADYIAPGDNISFRNFSNIVLATSDIWGALTTHWYAGTTGYGSEIADSAGNSWLAATGPVTMKSAVALPEGTVGQELNVYLEIIEVGKAVYTYTWKTGEQTLPSLTKSKITLYLSGSKQQLTYQIALKNYDGYTVTYKSRKASIATVSKNGLVQAKKAGSANIVVSFKKGSKIITKIIKVEVKKS